MFWTNYHSHCHYCDGKMPPEAHVLAAIEQGVKIYGFSSHSPVPFENVWSMKELNLQSYLSEIEGLKEKYRDQLEIYKSLEIDFIPGELSPESRLIKNSSLDYTLGSVHFVGRFEDGTCWEIDSSTEKFKRGLSEIYQGDVKRAVSEYFNLTRRMIEEACPDIIGHMDKIKMHNAKEFFFSESETWYKHEIMNTLETIKAAGAIVEVNTRGIYKKLTEEPYPGIAVLKELQKMRIPICLNSDSHHPSDITKEFRNAASLLEKLGFRKMRILHRNEWMDVDFNEHGLYL